MTALLCCQCYKQSPKGKTTFDLVELGWNWIEWTLENGYKHRMALCKKCSKEGEGTKVFAKEIKKIEGGKKE